MISAADVRVSALRSVPALAVILPIVAVTCCRVILPFVAVRSILPPVTTVEVIVMSLPALAVILPALLDTT